MSSRPALALRSSRGGDRWWSLPDRDVPSALDGALIRFGFEHPRRKAMMQRVGMDVRVLPIGPFGGMPAGYLRVEEA